MVVFLIRYCILGFCGVYIIPNWLIKAPGPFPILFRCFLELRKFCKSGPIALLIITSMLQRIQENMESFWGNIICVNTGLIFWFFSKICPRYLVFVFFVFLWTFAYIFQKYFCGDEDRKVTIVSINKIHKNFDMNFIYINKNMKWKFGRS